MYQSNQSFKFPPFLREFEFLENFCKIPPPHRAVKLFKCPHPWEYYQITVLNNFSVVSIMLLKLCM